MPITTDKIIDRINQCDTYEEYLEVEEKIVPYVTQDRMIIAHTKHEKRKSFESDYFHIPIRVTDVVLTDKNYNGICELLSRAKDERELKHLCWVMSDYILNLTDRQKKALEEFKNNLREHLKTLKTPLTPREKKIFSKALKIIKQYGDIKDYINNKMDKRIYEDIDYINYILWLVYAYIKNEKGYYFLIQTILDNTNPNLKKLIKTQISDYKLNGSRQ